MSKATALLGLGEEPTAAEVREAYRKLALIHHPDSGGDPEKFKVIHDAYTEALEEVANRPCENCKGKGKVPVQLGWAIKEETCPDCGGSGYPG